MNINIEIEMFVKNKHMTYLDAIIEVCKKKGIDVEDVKKHLNQVTYSKLYHEAQKLNLVEKVPRLDLTL